MELSVKCEVCRKKFRSNVNLDSHFDEHTPFWNDEVVRVSGADQVRLMLKKWSNGWEKFLQDEKKRIKQKGDYDYNKAIRLKEFEEKNGIEFVVCGDKVESFKKVTRRKKCNHDNRILRHSDKYGLYEQCLDCGAYFQ